MTDPLDDYPLPSSYVFVKSESDTAFITYHELPRNGVHTLVISTEYPPGVEVRLSPRRDWSTQRAIAVMPEGTGMRSITLPGIGVRDEYQFLTIATNSQLAGTDHRCTLQIITTPLVP